MKVIITDLEAGFALDMLVQEAKAKLEDAEKCLRIRRDLMSYDPNRKRRKRSYPWGRRYWAR